MDALAGNSQMSDAFATDGRWFSGALHGAAARAPRSQTAAALLVLAMGSASAAFLTVVSAGDAGESGTIAKIAAGCVAGVAFVLTFLLDTRFALMLLLVIRPVIDVFRDAGIGVTERFATINPAALASALVIAMSALGLSSRRLLLRGLPALPPLAVLLVMAGAVTAARRTPSVYFWADYVRLLSIGAIYVLSANVFNSVTGLRKLTRAICVAGIVPVAAAILEFFTESGQWTDIAGRPSTPYPAPAAGIMRLRGVFEAPGALGVFLVIIFAILLARAGSGGRTERRLCAWFAAVVVACIYLTYSRAAWVCVLVITAVSLIAARRWIVLGVICVSLVTLIAARPDAAARFSDPVSILDRVLLWTGSWEHLSTADKIVGSGLGAWFDLALAGYGSRVEAHNEYLRIVAEMGLWGILVHVWLLAATLGPIVRHRGWRATGEIRELRIAFLGLLLGLLCIAVTDNLSRHLVLQWYLWSVVGGLHGLMRQTQCPSALAARSTASQRPFPGHGDRDSGPAEDGGGTESVMSMPGTAFENGVEQARRADRRRNAHR